MATAGEGGGEFSVASDPDFAAVCSFLQVFGPACALDVPSISDLQRLLEDTQEVADALRELHLKLLRRAVKWVKPERWERALIKFCHQHGLHKEAWELERFSYKKASSRVKLTLLKVLLEYQFTCHTKFKNSVNALKSTELRLEPVGRDRGGRVYWLHTDSEANLRLYREDQDEETWSLIARDRDGLMKVIGQLKNSEDSETVDETLLNEDSNSLEASLTVKEKKDEDNEDSNEEFLSPESETDHESDSNQELKDVTENKAPTSINDEMKSKGDLDLKETLKINSDPADEPKSEKHNPETESKDHTEESDTRPQKEFKVVSSEELPITSPENTKAETLNVIKDSTLEEIKISEEKYEENVSSIITVVENKIESKKPNDDLEPSEDTVGPAIEEPIMLVTGEGSGADCEGVWEEICEPVMYIWGAGCGVECSTGNPGEIVAKASTHEDTLGNTNPPIEGLVLAKTSSCNNIPTENNGANSSDVDSNYKSNKQGNDVLENCSDKLKSENHQPITKRVLQETSEDTVSEHKQVESTPKKPCIWNVESMVKKSESSDDACFEKKLTGNKITKKTNCKSEENGCKVEDGKLKIEQSGSNSNADELKQSASKCKKKYVLSNDEEVNSADDLKPNPEGSGKKNIVEKRKSSLSSEDDKCVKIPDSEENSSPSGKKQSGKHKAKPRNKGNAKTFCKPDIESLPPKKLRLDSSTDDYDKEISDKSTLVNRRSKKIVKNDSPNKRESRKTLSIVSNCSTENKDSTEVDESGILIKEIKVGHHSNNVEKNDLEGGVATKDCESDAKEPTPQRSIRKVGRGKLRRRLLKKPVEKVEEAPVDSDSDKNLDELAQKRKVTPVRPTDASSEKSTSLKRGLQPEKRKRNRNQDNSVSEEENEELLTGKRLKIKPKKIVLSSRKKVEEKVNNRKDSSEDSEEVEVAPKRGKVKRSSSPKKELKEKSAKKNKKKRGSEGKSKKSRGGAEGGVAEESGEDVSPVRQSRRIAQLKIREEAERRQMEEVALRELKMKHKKTKTEEGEEEWKASGASSDSEEERRGAQRRRGNKWPASDTSQPSSGSDTDERLFDREYEEPDLVFKSDHEFSPESDIEDDSSSEPLKRARTLKEEAEGFCTRCGRGDHPEWILLCDDCDSGYHASCLKPVLFLVPDGDWFCPPCQHQRLIAALEEQLVKYDELAKIAEVGKTKRRKLELEAKQEAEEEEKRKKKSGSEEESSSEWSSSDEGTVYRLRERRQVPVSLRAQEYDRLMSSAIKEEYKEPESSAGNQGRGKDISTIIEAAEEEKQKELEAAQQSGAGGGEAGGGERRSKPRRPRRKPRKLNSLEVPSEDDNDTDEDFKEAGWETSSESISSDAEGDTRSESRSSDSLPIRRSGREGKKSRKKIVESPELKKKKGVFEDTSSESSGAKDWANKKKQSPKKRYDKTFPKKSKKKRGLKQYDAEGNVIKQRVKYGGLSGSEGSNDWSPKHRTRQKKINYTEMPNTESEDEMHKPSGKHMPDSSDEYRLDDSDDSDSEAGRGGGGAGAGAGEGDGDGGGAPAPGAADGTAADEHKVNALRELVKKTAVVPLHKLPEDVTRAKAEALEAQLNARVEAVVGTATPRAPRGRGGRGGRGSRGPRRGGAGRGRSPGTAATSAATPTTPGDPLSNLVGVKIKDLSQRDATPTANQVEREKKRVEREARIAEKEARKLERLKKKEEREQLREQKARERDEKRAAKAALAEGRRQRRDKTEGLPVPIPIAGYGAPPRPARPDGARMGLNINQQFADFQRMRQAGSYRPGGGGGAGPGEGTPMPRLQVRPELRAMRPDLANVRAHHPPPPHAAPHPPHPPHYPAQHHAERRDAAMREGTLSVAGSPQPFKPATDPPSIITRMPHMMPPQYRGPPMYMSGSPYGPPPPGARPPHMMYMHPHPHAHPLDPSPSGGGPINMNSRHPYPAPGPGGGYYPRGYPPPRFPPPHAEPSVSTPPPAEPKIKSEIKTEPEAAAGSPPASPPPSAHPPPPHPKIKHTESKERARTTAAARFPHGPYAPQYGPYGPYAPPPPDGYGAPMHPMHSTPPPGGHRMPPPPHSRPPPPHHLAAPPGAHHMPPGAPHPPPGTHHPSTGAPHPPPGTHHPSTGAPHPPPGTHHPSTGAPHPPPGTHHPSTGAPHPPPGAPHPPPGGTHHSSPGAPHPPPGAPHPPPGAHHTPPGAHHPPPGAPHPPPGAHHTQPGAHHPPPGAPHLPPGAHHTQPGAHHPPPGAPHPPPGAHHTQPGAHHPPPGAPHPPPGAHHTQPGAHHPPPGAPHPPPGAHHMPPGTPHPPPGAPHPPPGAHHMPPGAHHPPPGVHHPPPGAHHPPPQHPPAGPHHSSPHRPTPPPLPHHSAPPPLRHAPTAAHHAGPHHLPAPLHVPPGPPHRPASPMTSHTTPPPSLQRRTPEPLHNPEPKKVSGEPVNRPPSADSVNLVAHERLRSPSPPPPPAPAAPRSPAERTSPARLAPLEPTAPKAPEPPAEAPGDGEPRAAPRGPEDGVFGGLVSYFSSQQEDDLDG